MTTVKHEAWVRQENWLVSVEQIWPQLSMKLEPTGEVLINIINNKYSPMGWDGVSSIRPSNSSACTNTYQNINSIMIILICQHNK